MFDTFFGAFGSIFDGHWHWRGNWFNRDVFTVFALVLIAILISRSRRPRRTGK